MPFEHHQFSEVLFTQEKLDQYTTWRIGGIADYFFRPTDLEQLRSFLASNIYQYQEVLWVGLGSNLLIRDKGFRGVVIHSLKGLGKIKMIDDTSSQVAVRFEAGVTCAKIAKYCTAYGLIGGAFFAGIPGTLGGALQMNAGAFGSDTWNYVEGVETIDAHGEVRYRTRQDFQIGYRDVQKAFPREWFVAGYLAFPKGNAMENSISIKKLLKKRNDTQPIGQLSCGSVFKNPPNYFAAQLIERSKLKGRSIGDAVVSSKHANFILNQGKASAQDVETLMQEVRNKVWLDSGIKLEPEVKIVGEAR